MARRCMYLVTTKPWTEPMLCEYATYGLNTAYYTAVDRLRELAAGVRIADFSHTKEQVHADVIRSKTSSVTIRPKRGPAGISATITRVVKQRGKDNEANHS